MSRFRLPCLVVMATLFGPMVVIPAHAQSAMPRFDVQGALEPAAVMALLASGDSREQAWGAWAAGQARIGAAVPRLLEIVASRLPGTDWRLDGIPLDAALDTLIQLDARVSPSLLARVYERRPASALILLSKLGPDGDSLLLPLLEGEHGIKWFAAADLLLAHKTPGTAVLLLRGLQIDAAVYMSEDGTRGSRGSGGSGVGVGDGPQGRADGYPPVATYYLTTGVMPGNVVLADGPTPICYRRNTAPPGGTPAWVEHEITGPETADRLRYAAALGRLDPSLPISAQESRSVRWRGQDDLDHEINVFREDISRRYWALVRMLIAAKVMTEDEGRALPAPKIDVQVHDLRF